MNTIYKGLLVIFCIMSIVSCKDVDDFEKDILLSKEPYCTFIDGHYGYDSYDNFCNVYYRVDYEANTISSIHISTDETSTHWQFSNVPSWMTLSPMSGISDGDVEITVSPNTSLEMRRACITLTSSDIPGMDSIVIEQERYPIEIELLAGGVKDSYKKWTWDTEFRKDGAVWGNMGYAVGDDWSDGIWWGATPEGLADQFGLDHSDTGVATGEESSKAYMIIYSDGNIYSVNDVGLYIRSGVWSIDGWRGSRSHPSINGSQTNWSYGTLKTTAGSILFPFMINGYGYKPTAFEILQLDDSHLKLVYAAPGTGDWGEATWWAFKKK